MGQRRHRIVIAFDWSNFVRTLRELHLDVSQEALARELGVCTASISNWERGVCIPQARHRGLIQALAVRNRYRRHLWPSKSWVEQWSDDLP